jgi:hypothetical protein
VHLEVQSVLELKVLVDLENQLFLGRLELQLYLELLVDQEQ